MRMFNYFPVQEFAAKRRHNFLVDDIKSDNISFYVKTMLYVNWICYTSHAYFF